MLQQMLNPEVQARAFKSAKWKSKAIIDYGITPDMSKDSQNVLIKKLAIAKAIKEGHDEKKAEEPKVYEKFIQGQAFYVELLVKFADLPVKERFQVEYDQAFPDIASYDEMLATLEAGMQLEPVYIEAREAQLEEAKKLEAERTESTTE